jgi:hypothetical protein
MNKHSWTWTARTAALVIGIIGFGIVPARAATIGGFLGAAASSTDVYGLTCPVQTQSVRARVNEGNTTGVQFSVVVINPLGRATAASAVDNGLSPVAILDGEAGNYLVTVHKDAEGGEGYNVTIDCHDANGSALGIRATRLQNE